MLNADLCLKNAAASRRRKNQSKSTDVEEESSFHFIAFVPIEGRVWKLDGLERQPHSLGKNMAQQSIAKPSVTYIFRRSYH